MDFKQLRSFVAVADCGSFTQAAAKLYASQPTVSAHIRQLEEELHETLFLRTTKSLAITPRGRELYDYAVHVLDLQEQLRRRTSAPSVSARRRFPRAAFCPRFCPRFARSTRRPCFRFCKATATAFCSSFARAALNSASQARRRRRRTWCFPRFLPTVWCSSRRILRVTSGF